MIKKIRKIIKQRSNISILYYIYIIIMYDNYHIIITYHNYPLMV